MTFLVLRSNASLAIEFIIKLFKFGGFGRAYASIEKKNSFIMVLSWLKGELLKGELLGDAILTWQTKSPKGLQFSFHGVSFIAYILICILLPIMLYNEIFIMKIKDVSCYQFSEENQFKISLTTCFTFLSETECPNDHCLRSEICHLKEVDR